jgi:glycine/D-amino acid oxidase-like deaminating enzyme
VSQSIYADDFKPHPFWWDDSPRPTFDQPLPQQVDLLIIGSGYTGLNCALETTAGGMDTLVIDTQAIGWGCSSRNGGQISGGIKPDYEKLKKKYGEKQAFDLVKCARTALTWITEFIAAQKIDCDFRNCGRFHAAHNPWQFRNLAAIADNQPKGLEQELEVIERKNQADEIDSDFYHGGLVMSEHCSLDPGRYHQGLVDRALASGCRLISNCEALKIDRESSSYSVITSKGVVKAKKVVVATNGYTGPVSPWQRQRIIPIGSYMLATEPVAATRMTQLMPKDRVFSDSRKMVTYFHRSADSKRLLFGGRVSVFESDPVKSAPALRQEMLRIFPQLEDVKLTHAWMGFVGFTFDYLPHLGEQDGLFYAMGYCGSGISLASYFGNRLGLQVLGKSEGKIAFNDTNFQTRPTYTGVPWFLSAAVRYYQLRDRLG